jgi:hypothetical protein
MPYSAHVTSKAKLDLWRILSAVMRVWCLIKQSPTILAGSPWKRFFYEAHGFLADSRFLHIVNAIGFCLELGAGGWAILLNGLSECGRSETSIKRALYGQQ